MIATNDKAIEQKARRAARRVNLEARKSRWRLDSIDNYGGFRIVDPYRNAVVAGERFDMSAEEVIQFCQHRPAPLQRSRFRPPFRYERRASD
jgi:hypothetical protein